MKPEVDPCDNFYEFACGNWHQRYPRPPESIHWSAMDVLKNKLLEETADLLSEDDPDDIVAVQVAKKYYRSCMDTETRERVGLDPLKSLLQRRGGWPIILQEEEWAPDIYSWQKIENSYGHLTNIFAFVAFKCIKSPLTGNCILELTRPFLPFTDRQRNFERKLLYDRNKYSTLIQKVAVEFARLSDAKISMARIRSDVEEIIKFERNINSAPAINVSTMTLMELQNFYNLHTGSSSTAEFNWVDSFITLFKEYDLNIDEKEIVSVDKSYFRHLSEVLQKTPSRTIVNYIHWNFLSNMLKASNMKMRNLAYQATKNIPAVVRLLEPSTTNCIRGYQVNIVLGYMYGMKYYTKEMDKEGNQMINNLVNTLKKMLSAINWLDDSSRNFMIQKIDNLVRQVGPYKVYYDKEKVEQIFKLEWVIGTNWIENSINERKFHLRKILRTVNTEEGECMYYDMPFLSELDEMQAEYSPENEMTISPGFFRAPVFLPKVESINYGGFGLIIGHELAHAIDPTNHNYKGYELISWPESTENAYKERAFCFIYQYNEYYDITTNKDNKSSVTLDENFADTIGIQIAFSALKKLKKIRPLPEFEDYTKEQQFFIAFANTQCEMSDPTLYLEDIHSPGGYRVIATLRNSKDFAKAFKCPVGSPMNPKDKCNFWK